MLKCLSEWVLLELRDLFKQAKDKSPAIIFIDEIDAIGRARGKSNMTGSNDERENTLNQLIDRDGWFWYQFQCDCYCCN